MPRAILFLKGLPRTHVDANLPTRIRDEAKLHGRTADIRVTSENILLRAPDYVRCRCRTVGVRWVWALGDKRGQGGLVRHAVGVPVVGLLHGVIEPPARRTVAALEHVLKEDRLDLQAVGIDAQDTRDVRSEAAFESLWRRIQLLHELRARLDGHAELQFWAAVGRAALDRRRNAPRRSFPPS